MPQVHVSACNVWHTHAVITQLVTRDSANDITVDNNKRMASDTVSDKWLSASLPLFP